MTKFWKEEKNKEKPKKKPQKPKVSLDGEKVRDGLAQLILTVVELLRELMEKQAIRRIEKGTLSEEQVERLGTTFQSLKKEVKNLKEYFELEDEDLNLNLGPLTLRDEEELGIQKQASVVEILDRLLAKGVVAKGDVVISVAEVDLISLNLGLLLASIDKANEFYNTPKTKELEKEVEKLRKEAEILKKRKI